MALIPKRSKKKEPAIDLEIINAQWKVYEDGEQFNLIVNGEDISDRVIIELTENNDMIIFDSETSCYFLLNDLDSVSENELQEVKGYISSHGIAIISFEGFETYYLMFNGEIISDDTDSFWFNEDLIFWVPQGGDYYFLAYSQNPVDNEILIPVKMDFPNNTLWLKDENDYFNFYIEGQDFAARMNSAYLDDSFLLYDKETGYWYIFPDWDNASLNTPYAAGVFDIEGEKLWAKTNNEGSYQLYDKGLSVDADNLKASYCNEDVIVYNRGEGVHYLLTDFNDTELFELHEPEVLPANTHAVWMKPAAKQFKLFLEGKDISRDVESKIMDGNLLMIHEATNKIYVGLDYNNQPLDEFQPAVIMDAT